MCAKSNSPITNRFAIPGRPSDAESNAPLQARVEAGSSIDSRIRPACAAWVLSDPQPLCEKHLN